MGGVLKSCAFPKGPGRDPKIKHLAMMVEDHALDYWNFEGSFSRGIRRGAVIVSDWYQTIEKIDGRKERVSCLLSELATGSVKMKPHGKKVKGGLHWLRLKASVITCAY